MVKCSYCKCSGQMLRCTKCGQNWCPDCAKKGIGHYPHNPLGLSNCVYCGANGAKFVVRFR